MDSALRSNPKIGSCGLSGSGWPQTKCAGDSSPGPGPRGRNGQSRESCGRTGQDTSAGHPSPKIWLPTIPRGDSLGAQRRESGNRTAEGCHPHRSAPTHPGHCLLVPGIDVRAPHVASRTRGRPSLLDACLELLKTGKCRIPRRTRTRFG